MYEHGFTILKRFVAILCMAVVLVVSVQSTLVVSDHINHLMGVEHAPNALAGPTLEHLGPPGDHAGDHHSHGAGPHQHQHHDADHGQPAGHHHVGDGMLSGWVGVASIEVAPVPTSLSFLARSHTAPPAAYYVRHDRPPKPLLDT